jgi:hypothetical protein
MKLPSTVLYIVVWMHWAHDHVRPKLRRTTCLKRAPSVFEGAPEHVDVGRAGPSQSEEGAGEGAASQNGSTGVAASRNDRAGVAGSPRGTADVSAAGCAKTGGGCRAVGVGEHGDAADSRGIERGRGCVVEGVWSNVGEPSDRSLCASSAVGV